MIVQPTNKTWRLRAWRGLVWLSCALLVFGLGSPAFSAPAPVLMPPAELDGEESAPVQDDDEDGEGGLVAPATPRWQRCSRLCLFGVLRVNRLVHLPHHHAGQPGYSLPVCTPFERGGVLLPLRC
jgi:hypothetical protein